jgi:hypothetical protein
MILRLVQADITYALKSTLSRDLFVAACSMFSKLIASKTGYLV